MFWRTVKDVSYQAEGTTAFAKSRMRASFVRPGQMPRFIEQMKKVTEVYKQKKYSGSFSMSTRQGMSQEVNAVTFNGFANWAWFDEDVNFTKDFEEVHGANSYSRFLEEIDLCMDRSKTYDQLAEVVPSLSSN